MQHANLSSIEYYCTSLQHCTYSSPAYSITTLDDGISMPDDETLEDAEMIQLQQATKLIPKRLLAREDPVITPEIFQRNVLKQVRRHQTTDQKKGNQNHIVQYAEMILKQIQLQQATKLTPKRIFSREDPVIKRLFARDDPVITPEIFQCDILKQVHQTTGRKTRNQNNIVQDVEMHQLLRATKIIPKRLGDDPLITPEIFQRDILKQVQQRLVRHHQPLLAWFLDARLEENLDDDDSFLLKARGPKEALDYLREQLEEFFRREIAAHNLRLLLCDGASVQVDIQMNRQVGKLGARIYCMDDKESEGVWVSHVSPDQELAKVLGPDATKRGSAIVGIDGKRVRNHSEFTRLLKKAKETDGTMTIALLLNKFADLSKIDQSRLVYAGEGPCRQDGRPYSNPHSTPPPKRSRTAAALQRRAFFNVLADEENVEIDLEMTAKESLGIRGNLVDSKPKGLWIFEFKPDGQLERILGKPACTVGAAILRVGGVACNNADQMKTVSKNAARFDGHFRVTLCFFNGTDFSAMDQSRLVKGRVNPRRRNGEPYSMSGAVPLLPTRVPDQRRSVAPSARGTEVSARAKTAASGNRGSGTEKTEATKTGGKKRTAVEESRERTPKIARTMERATEKTVASTGTKLAKNISVPKHNQSYLNFKSKAQTASKIEFQGTAIAMTRAISLMWTRHKKLFGEVDATCDENCQCLFRLPELTENVVEDFIAGEKEKNSDWTGNTTTTGFVSHFFQRFLPLIRSEYPNENARDCLERLVGMWRLHQKNQSFGFTCRETCDCDCAGSWEIVFHMGDTKGSNKPDKLPRQENSVRAAKKQKLNAGSSGAAICEAGSMNVSLPRKQKAKATSLLEPYEYEVKFNPQIPLGAYFVTEKSSTGTSKCKVHSVWQNGQIKSDPRVHPGTIVQSVLFGDDAFDIDSHINLKQQYEESKVSGTSLRLKLINPDEAPISVLETATCERKDWTNTGAWLGKAYAGWPGGSEWELEWEPNRRGEISFMR
jgi:hypothetical protein